MLREQDREMERERKRTERGRQVHKQLITGRGIDTQDRGRHIDRMIGIFVYFLY